jgi:hypothetical protein
LLSRISGSYGSEYEGGSFWVVAPCSLVEFTDVSEVLDVSIIRAIALMMEDYTALQPRRQPS